MVIIVDRNKPLTSVSLKGVTVKVELYCDKCRQWYDLDVKHECPVVIDGVLRDPHPLLTGGEDD